MLIHLHVMTNLYTGIFSAINYPRYCICLFNFVIFSLLPILFLYSLSINPLFLFLRCYHISSLLPNPVYFKKDIAIYQSCLFLSLSLSFSHCLFLSLLSFSLCLFLSPLSLFLSYSFCLFSLLLSLSLARSFPFSQNIP